MLSHHYCSDLTCPICRPDDPRDRSAYDEVQTDVLNQPTDMYLFAQAFNYITNPREEVDDECTRGG